LYTEGIREVRRHYRERHSGPQPFRAQDVCREILVSEQEPRFLTIAGDCLERVSRVSRNAPSVHRVGDPGQGVHHRIQVRGDMQSIQLKIICCVDHHGQVARRQRRLQTLRHLCPTDAPRKRDDHVSLLAVELAAVDVIDVNQE
jgi:hypothetical protein